MELFHMITRSNHTRGPESVDRYKAEPYAVAADVYAHPLHLGRGGWSWYTGRRVDVSDGDRGRSRPTRGAGVFSIDPAIPAMWPRYSIDWKAGGTRYHITVLNPEHQCRGVRSAEIDGVLAEPHASRCSTTARLMTSGCTRQPPRPWSMEDRSLRRARRPLRGSGCISCLGRTDCKLQILIGD